MSTLYEPGARDASVTRETRPSPRGAGFWGWQVRNLVQKVGCKGEERVAEKNRAAEAAVVSLGREQSGCF